MDSRKKIINAGIKIFSERGKHGAHLDEIAALAGINKAMVYYYYSNKENLYREVLKNVILKIHDYVDNAISKIDINDKDVVRAIEKVVRTHFNAFSKSYIYPKLIFGAFINEPQDMLAVMNEVHKNSCYRDISNKGTHSIIARGILEKKLRKVNIKQTLISIIGMDMIYFIGKPIASSMLNINIKNEKAFLNERQDSIVYLLLYGIVERGK